MRSTKHSTAKALALITLAALAIGGCSSAPDRFIDGVGHTVDHQKVTTARAQRIANFPCLRVNAETLDDLRRAMEADDVEVARDTGIRFLDGARELANEVTSDEMERLADDATQREGDERPERSPSFHDEVHVLGEGERAGQQRRWPSKLQQ